MDDHGLVPSALADTGQRLSSLDDKLGFVTVVPPDESGWMPLDGVIRADTLDALATDIQIETGHRSTAASYLTSRLSQPLVSRTVAAVILDQRCPDPSLASIVVHRRRNSFDRLAFTGPCAAVVGDPAALEPDNVEVADRDAIRSWWARNVTAALGPVLAASHARLRIGRRGMWSIVATRVASTAVALDRQRGGSGETGWIEATLLLDALAEHAPVEFTRPTPLSVGWDGGALWYTTKATCCLKYHTKPTVDRDTGVGLCSTCPLVAPECRIRQLTAKLQRSAGLIADR